MVLLALLLHRMSLRMRGLWLVCAASATVDSRLVDLLDIDDDAFDGLDDNRVINLNDYLEELKRERLDDFEGLGVDDDAFDAGSSSEP